LKIVIKSLFLNYISFSLLENLFFLLFVQFICGVEVFSVNFELLVEDVHKFIDKVSVNDEFLRVTKQSLLYRRLSEWSHEYWRCTRTWFGSLFRVFRVILHRSQRLL